MVVYELKREDCGVSVSLSPRTPSADATDSPEQAYCISKLRPFFNDSHLMKLYFYSL